MNPERDIFAWQKPRLFIEPRCYSFVAIAIGGGAALTAGATVVSSVESSEAQAKAAQQQAQSQQNANQTNLQEFEESRGSTGSAVLPLYLKESGLPFEGQMGQDLISAYNETGTPLSTFQSAAAPLATSETKANEFTNDIFTGGVTNKLLEQAQPVQQARLSSARQNAMTTLNQTLDAIDAAQAGKGFSGDSFGNRSLRFQANLGANNSISTANEANLGETQQIKNYGDVTLPLNNLSLPSTMAGQNEAYTFLPQASFLQSKVAQQQPFNFMRIGPGTPPSVAPLPTAPPGLSTGNAIAQGVGSVGSAALNYYLNQSLQQQNMSQAAQANAQGVAQQTAALSGSPFVTSGLAVEPFSNSTSILNPYSF